MKKRVLSCLIILVMSVLCLACGKDEKANQPVKEPEKVVEDTQQEEETEPEVPGRGKVEDKEVIADITELLQAEYELLYHIECEWPVDETKTYKKGDYIYYLVNVEGATSWEYYENLAREVYTETYVTEEFTPFYGRDTLYVEHKGKLYRAPADGIINTLVEGSVEVFENTEGRYYVTAFNKSIDEEIEVAYIVEKADSSKYGYLIVESIGYIK